MKSYKYQWTSQYYLLHLQFNNPSRIPFEAVISREFSNGAHKTETETAKDGMDSHRILVSRSHPKEINFTVEYPGSVELEIYQLDDRAYYPTNPVYKS